MGHSAGVCHFFRNDEGWKAKGKHTNTGIFKVAPPKIA
jgi:hypothetical protein